MRWGLFALSICACHQVVREEPCGTDRAELREYGQASEACESGDLAACVVEAQWLERGGFFVRRDRELAGTLRRRACDGGVGEGCRVVEATAPPVPETPPPPIPETPAPPTQRAVADVHVECLPNEVRFLGRSEHVFDDVAATLNDHPEITRLFLEGHASPDERARSRADAVVRELVRRHIDGARLVPSGTVEPASRPRRGVTFRSGS